jgi:LuxR family maltose regulon positive regulatory protein
VSRWLLQGRLLRLPKKELLFTKAEVAAVLPAALSSAALQRLFVLTEGWPAAVKLAEVCLDEWRHHVSSLDTLPSYFRMIGEYCSAEVLRGMDPQGTELLTDCAVFEQIEPDLCDAVCQREDSAERLTGLAGRETLLDPLDTAANTWRIPGIMRLHLLRRAAEQGPARLAAIHVRAAQRYEARDDTLAAVRHYVAAGEGRSAALCFERVSPITNACLRGDVLGAAILELIPPQYVAQFPRLALCRVYLDYKMGLLEEARYLLETLAVRTSNFTHDRDGGDDDQLVAESLAATLLMDLYRLSGVSRMYLQSAEDRITRITRINPRLAGFAHEIVGIFYAMRGDLDVAGEHFIQCEKLTTQEPAPWVDLWLIYHRASQALARGLLMEARHHLHTGFRTWRRDFPTNKTFGASVNLLLAVIDYESDALEEAQAKIDDALYTVSHIEGWHEQYAVAYETATMILASTGRYDDAYEFLTRVSSNKRVHAVLEEFVALLRMRVALMQSGAGNVPIEAGYLHVGAGWGPPATHDAMNCRAWDLTGLCLCISAILAKDLERATAVLDTLEKAARVSRRLRTLVKALVLRAAVCARQGAQQEVMTYMVQALEIGRTQGYRRTFLDEGWLIRPILAQLAQAQAPQLPGRLSLFAGRLLAALDARGAAGSSGSKLLSEREIEVLRELNLGHANKVISRKLDLRESTVKFHLQNIFRKLGVRRRDAALADARRRGLLD